ncbi:hypothetical protein DPMN_011715 [Dreissena polymorpha]|uniref:MAM domain-containing protein n=1 Tax=Dreissena polymorpha TaxID=45954 RepID=A0A9D4N6N2_DREPO|nr:hypothetical protein DPMN_011715 [Dreissena polymorpha]
MYGTDINTLLVYQKSQQGTGLGNNIWKKSGNQGNLWVQATVTLQPQTGGYKVL